MPVDHEKARRVVDEVREKAARDPELAARARSEPEMVLKEHGLSEQEIQADPGASGECNTFATSLSGSVRPF